MSKGTTRRRERRGGEGSAVLVAAYQVCYLARGPHNFPSQPMLRRPPGAESAATLRRHILFQLAVDLARFHVSPKVT